MLGDAEDVFAVPLKVVGDVDAAAQVQARHVLLLAAGALKEGRWEISYQLHSVLFIRDKYRVTEQLVQNLLLT